jgi:hypothetical protein
MHAMIRTYETSASTAEIATRVEAMVLPLLKARPGFRGYWAGRSENGVFSVSLFDDEAEMEAAHEQVRGIVAANLAELLPTPPAVTRGEVLVAATG